MDVKESLKDLYKSLGRAFGFFYPDRLITINKEDKQKYFEDPKVKKIEMSKVPQISTKITDIQTLKNINQHLEDSEDDRDRTYTVIKDRETDKVVVSQGNAEENFKPKKITDFYSQAGMSLFIPGFLIYTMLLIWSFGIISMGYLETMIIVFLGSTMLYQGYHVFNNPIQVLSIAYKGQISNLEYYVPMRSRYLAIHETKDKDLISDTVRTIVSNIRSIMAENVVLNKENNNMESRVQKAIKIGQRKMLGQMKQSSVPGWIWLLLVFSLGFLVGWLFMGGIKPAPEPETSRQVIKLISGGI